MSKSITILLDIDGVLADYLTAIREALGMPKESIEYFIEHPERYTIELFDEAMGGPERRKDLQNTLPHTFWQNLDKLPWADELVKKLTENFPVTLLTSPGRSVEAPKGKMLWQQQHYPTLHTAIARNKYMFASMNKVLIDDDDFQTTNFTKNGGPSIQWTNQFVLNALDEKQRSAHIDQIIAGLKQYQATLK